MAGRSSVLLDDTATAAIDLAVKRLQERINDLPPFSELRRDLIEEKSNLIDQRRRLYRMLYDVERMRG